MSGPILVPLDVWKLPAVASLTYLTCHTAMAAAYTTDIILMYICGMKYCSYARNMVAP